MKDAPLSDILRQTIIKTENQFMAFYDCSWQDFLDIGINKGANMIFDHDGPIDYGTNVPVSVYQSSAENECNAACTSVTDLEYLRMLINELLNKDPYIVPEEAPIIRLNIKSAVCMAKNGKDTNNTRYIARRVHLVSNGEKCKMHKIDWCEEGLQLEDIETMNVSENDLNTRMKYIMVRLDNWRRTLVQEG